MKAIAYSEFGSSQILKIQDVPVREPNESEVMIKIAYTSVNPVDWKIRMGYLKGMLPHEFPIIPGWDAAGEIAKVGEGVTRWKAGDKVMAYTRLPKVHAGTYAEFICIPQDYLAKVPASMSLPDAAATPLVGLTAYQALHRLAKITKDDHVLVTAGAGGVGSFAIQFAKVIGAKVTATAQTNNHGYMKELGADYCVDYTKSDSLAQLQKAAPQGFSVVMDCAGGDSLKQAWQVAAKGARLVSIVETPDSAAANRPDVKATYHFVEPNGAELTAIADLIDENKVQLPTVEIKSVKQAAEAQDENQGRRVRGKVVLKIDF